MYYLRFGVFEKFASRLMSTRSSHRIIKAGIVITFADRRTPIDTTLVFIRPKITFLPINDP
jgi:hypothetical protein